MCKNNSERIAKEFFELDDLINNNTYILMNRKIENFVKTKHEYTLDKFFKNLREYVKINHTNKSNTLIINIF